VEHERVVIRLPDECLSPRVLPRQASWLFKGYSGRQLIDFMSGMPLSPEEETGLLHTNSWQFSNAGILLTPSPQSVLALSPANRKRIYQALAEFSENAAQARPYHWLAEDEEALFRACPVSPDTRKELARLCYRYGKQVLFADLDVLLPRLASENERRALVGFLSAQFGVLLRLEISTGSDINALVRYWGVAGLGKTLRPVLEAAARTEHGRKIPVLGLLPSAMRGRLYTFPSSPPDLELDGYWTAANFFTADPVSRRQSVLDWLQKCKTEYHPVSSDPRFGDVLMLTRSDGRLLHSCVYLADDIVFTKNASGTAAPWMLMKVADLLGHFSASVPEGEPLRVAYIRNKAI
jgi:hypothetical protein